jgi:restriction endonuclease S subunit
LTYRPENICDNGTIVLRSSNIKNNKIDLNDLVRVNTEIQNNQYINNNDILICARNGSKALVGKCALFTCDGERMAFGAFMAIFRTICYKYTYYFFTSTQFRSNFENEDNKQINQVTQEILKNSLIPVPPLKEQYKISEMLDKVFSLLDNISMYISSIKVLVNCAKIKILENIYGENSSYKSYYPSVTINDVCKLDNGIEMSAGKLPYLEAKVIRGSKEPKYIDKGIFISKGTNIILVDGENSGEIMKPQIDGYMGSTFKILKIDTSKINDDYISLFILYKKQELRDSKTGSAVPHLNKKLFINYELPLPTIEKQMELVNSIKNIFKALNSII